MKKDKIKLLTDFFRVVHTNLDSTMNDFVNILFDEFYSSLDDKAIRKAISLADSISHRYRYTVEEGVLESDYDFHLDGAVELLPCVSFRIKSDLLYQNLLQDFHIVEKSSHYSSDQEVFHLSNGFVADLRTKKYYFEENDFDFNYQKKHTQLLFAILRSETGLLTYEEIAEMFWPGSEQGEGADDIRKIRQALNKDLRKLGMDASEYNKMIVTESRQGYRLGAEIMEKA